jgi:hypothetical protein
MINARATWPTPEWYDHWESIKLIDIEKRNDWSIDWDIFTDHSRCQDFHTSFLDPRSVTNEPQTQAFTILQRLVPRACQSFVSVARSYKCQAKRYGDQRDLGGFLQRRCKFRGIPGPGSCTAYIINCTLPFSSCTRLFLSLRGWDWVGRWEVWIASLRLGICSHAISCRWGHEGDINLELVDYSYSILAEICDITCAGSCCRIFCCQIVSVVKLFPTHNINTNATHSRGNPHNRHVLQHER